MQTTIGNAGRLKIVAEYKGKQVGSSNSFSIVAIPVIAVITKMSKSGSSGEPRINHNLIIRSDSGRDRDLEDRIQISEVVDVKSIPNTLCNNKVFQSDFDTYRGEGTDVNRIDLKYASYFSCPLNSYVLYTQRFLAKSLILPSAPFPIEHSGYEIRYEWTVFSGIPGVSVKANVLYCKYGAQVGDTKPGLIEAGRNAVSYVDLPLEPIPAVPGGCIL